MRNLGGVGYTLIQDTDILLIQCETVSNGHWEEWEITPPPPKKTKYLFQKFSQPVTYTA